MRVEITEERLSTVDPDTGQLHKLGQGDTITVSDKFGALLCSRGWAKDVDGKVASAERKPGAVRVGPARVKINQKGG